MRKLTKCFANKFGISIIFCLLIVSLAVVTFTVTSAPLSNDNSTVAQALGENNSTMLANGRGLQFGTNALRTSADADFYVSSGNSSNVTFGSDSISVRGSATIVCKVRLNTNDAYYARVYYALLSENVAVSFSGSVTYRMTGTAGSEVSIQTQIAYSSSGDVIDSAKDEAKYNLVIPSGETLSESISTVLDQTSLGNNQPGAASCVLLQIKVIGASASNEVEIRNPSITATANTSLQQLDNSSGVRVEVSGTNRETIIISNALNPQGREALNKIYVKKGDKIVVETRVVGADNDEIDYERDPYYTLALGLADSCIDWHTYINGQYSLGTTYLSKYGDDSDNLYSGFRRTFVVGDNVSGAKTVCIIPRLIESYNGNSYTYSYPTADINIADVELSFKVDTKAPNLPKLDETKGLGALIKNKKWYTDTQTLYLDYAPNAVNVSLEAHATEYVYAFKVDAGFRQADANYDFSLASNKDLTYYVYGNNTALTAPKQNLGVFTHTNSATSGKMRFSFGPRESATVGLVLYAVDEAGNVSGAQVYCTQQSNAIKVDLTTRDVGAIISSGGSNYAPSPANYQTIAKYCNIYVLGNEHHNEDGTLKDSASDLTGATQITTKLIPLKRGQYVTVRIVISKTQAENSNLIRYANSLGAGQENPSYTYDKNDNKIYDVTYLLDGDLWELYNEATITLYFHKVVQIKLDNLDYTFNSDKVNLTTDDFTLSSIIDGGNLAEEVRPILNVEYFNSITGFVDIGLKSSINGKDEYASYAKFHLNDYTQTVLPMEDSMGESLIGSTTGYIIEFVEGGIYLISGESEYWIYSYEKEDIHEDVYNGEIRQFRRFYVVYFDKKAGHKEGFADAGTYIYRAYVSPDNSTYYDGELISEFTIKKATPGVIGAHSTISLEYGESLEKLEFVSNDILGEPIFDKMTFIGKEYIKIASGVYGTFNIVSPQIGSDEYKTPQVSAKYPITIEFLPMDLSTFTVDQILGALRTGSEEEKLRINEYFEPVVTQNGETIAFKLKESKKTAKNYSVETIHITVEITHKTIEIEFADVMEGEDENGDPIEYVAFSYNGLENEVSAKAKNGTDLIGGSDVKFIIEYYVSERWTKTPPVNAGNYRMRARIDYDNCSYTLGKDDNQQDIYIYAHYIINKRVLEINVKDGSAGYTKLDSVEQLEGKDGAVYNYQDALTYTYSRVTNAQYESSYQFDNETFVVQDLVYKFSFYKFSAYDANGNPDLIDVDLREWSEEADMLTPKLLDAGRYLMKVIISNSNNEGSLYVYVNVLQVQIGDDTNLSISTPTERKNYNLVHLDGTSLDKSGHIEYGQTLASMSSSILADNGAAFYSPIGVANQVRIASKFRLETEQEFLDRTGLNINLDKNGYNEDILPVRYNGDTIITYPVAIIWQAVKEDGTPDYNYRSEKIVMELYVVRAEADFSGFAFKDVTYGDKAEVAYQGEIVSHGKVFGNDEYTLTITESDFDTKIYEGGDNYIACSFVPGNSLKSKYAEINVHVKLTVLKREVAIDFTTNDVSAEESLDGQTFTKVVVHNYGETIFEPQVSVRAMGADIQGAITLRPQFRYLRDYVDGESLAKGESLFEYNGTTYVLMSGITTLTPVGKYYVLAEIYEDEKNYVGESFSIYYIIRSELKFTGGDIPQKTAQYGDNLKDIDFGKVSVENVNNGTKNISGKFVLYVLDNGEKVYDIVPEVTANSDIIVYIEFIPNDGEASEYANNYRAYDMQYYGLEVLKRDLAGTEYFVIENLEHVFDDSVKDIKVTAINPEDGTKLPINVDYATSHRFAGEHAVRVTVDESVAHFTADVEVTLVIKKAELNINVEGDVVNFKYNGSAIDYKPDFTIVDTNIPGAYSQANYNFIINYVHVSGLDINYVPFEIGSYKAFVTLDDQNFYIANGEYDAVQGDYVKEINVDVTPSFVDGEPFANLNQTYCVPGSGEEIKAVVANYDFAGHPYVEYLVEYKIGEVYYDDVIPFNAGSYDVRVRFSQNGYNKVFNLTMVIAKAMPNAVLNAEYERAYTGEDVEFSVSRPNGVETINYLFRANGTADEFTAVKPIVVGDYDVKVVYEGSNYYGELLTILKIVKGDFEITAAPKAAPIEFSSDSTDVSFIAGVGVVEFRGFNTFAERGYWSVVTDISEFEVGLYNVQVKFTLNADDVDFNNFNEAYGYMDLNIVKKDISDAITIADDYVLSEGVMKVTRNYIKEKVSVSPMLIDAETALVHGYVYNPQNFFAVYYNDNNSVPTDVNTYNVTVSISDPNYSGSISNVQLIIVKAVPVLTAPNFNAIRVGDVLSTEAHIQNGSGSANVKENGLPINGRFYIGQDFNVEMTKANVNTISIYFYPDDLDNVALTYMEVQINVIGDVIEILEGDVVVEKLVDGDVVYGMPLSSYSIKLSDAIANRLGLTLEEIGSVEWVNPDAILHVGDVAEFKFVPADTDAVTITYHTTALATISKSEMEIQDEEKILILYEGGVLSALPIELALYNKNATDMAVSGYSCAISSIDLDVDYVATASDIGKYLNGTVSITISHADYTDLVLDGYKVFVQRLVTDFNVANVNKYYDGASVTLADLGVTLAGTDYVPSENELAITSITLNGVAVSEIRDAGVYTVTIEIKENQIVGEGGQILFGSHAGSYTFTYTVSKLDLSDLIEVSGNETTYLQPNRLSVSFGGYQVEGSTIIYNFYSENYEHSYGAYAPNNAGIYKVVVTIADSNPYYKGSKEFDYVINKVTTNITLQPSYTYTYSPNGTPVNVVPEIENNVTDEYVSIAYAPIGSDIFTYETPANAGTYSVVVTVVNHPNIIGSASSIVIIRQATVNITVNPTIGSIGYGEMLNNATISGGLAENNFGDDILGHFEFENGEKNDLPVGDNSVNIVFIPADANYAKAVAPVNVTIVKGVIGIEFGELAKYYTGKALYPEVLTNVNVSYSFRQDGINVQNAITAGVYTCTVTVNDKNYTGSAITTFTIYKAKAFAEESTLPIPSGVVYGNVVGTGLLSGGSVVYVQGESGILGTFSYVDASTVLGDVGIYEGVQIVFNPADSANYEPFYAEISVEVVKANATITVSANRFVYGDRISKPVFTTDPQGLDVTNLDFDTNMYNTIQPAGTYTFEAQINAKNYQGSVQYAIFVTKKMIKINFMRNNVVVDAYRASYGNTYYADAGIILNTLVEGEDRYNYAQFEDKIIYKYTPVDGGQSTFIPPTKVGKYTVTAILEDANYLIDPAVNTIAYEVDRAHVTSIAFDSKSLSEQVYGSVSLPIVLTTPANVGYELIFDEYDTMPTNAGQYGVTVVIRDDNYYADELASTFRISPKPISIENIKVYNKAHDGLSTIEAVGDLKGVMSKDNVFLKLTAHTKDHATNVGTHSVVISGWELTGLHKNNYSLREPIYNLTVKITNKVITDPNTDSYITSPDGFSSNITVSFKDVYDTIDNTNFLTSLIGQKATVQVITIKENGLNTILDSKVKFHVRIPDEYLNARNLKVEGRGALSSVAITREGEYVTFYADTSGEIVFYKNDFPYWIIIVAGAVLILILGGIFTLILSPVRRRKRIPQGARRMYELTENLAGDEAQYKWKVKKQIEEKKRRWKY